MKEKVKVTSLSELQALMMANKGPVKCKIIEVKHSRPRKGDPESNPQPIEWIVEVSA